MMRRGGIIAAALAATLVLAACAGGGTPRGTGGNDSPAQINARLGLNYMQQGNYEVAMEKLQRALEQDPNLAEGHHYLAELYRTLRNEDKAEQHYRRALRLAPNDGSLQNNYAIFLCDSGRYGEAEERFVRAARTAGYQRSDEAYQNAANCMMRIPDPERAKVHLRQALDVNPLLPSALFQMATLSFDTGEVLPARAFLQRFEAVSRHNAQSLWLGVRIEHALDNGPAAADYARQLREQFPRAEETARLRELE
jgi:type IV pilus assembly protein PilF